MAGGAVSGSGNILEEDTYELEDGNSWGVRFPLFKAEKAESVAELRKFKEFNGSEFGAGEYRAEGPESPFYYVGDWGENYFSQPTKSGELKKVGKNTKEDLIKSANEEDSVFCDFNGGRKISKNCGGYGSREGSLKLEEKVDVDGGRKLEEMMSFITKGDAEGIEKLWRERTRELEEELFGVFKGRDFWIGAIGENRAGKIDLSLKNLGNLIDFLTQGKEILVREWGYEEIVDGGRIKLASGKTRVLGNLIKNYLTATKGSKDQKKNKDWMMFEVISNFLKGVEGDLGYRCNDKTAAKGEKLETLRTFFEECDKLKQNERIEVTRVVKSVGVESGRLYIPKAGREQGWWKQERGFTEEKKSGWISSYNVAKPILGLLDVLVTETCRQDGEDESDWLAIFYSRPKVTAELCKEIIKPGFGDHTSGKRVCYFKFKNGPQNYLRRGNFFNGMLKIPVWYKNADGYGAKCSVHGI